MKTSYKTVFVPTTVSVKTTGYDGTYLPDGAAFASRIEKACNQLDEEGYEVLSTVPVIGGERCSIYDGGAGWSYTTGVLITAVIQATQPDEEDGVDDRGGW